MANWWDSAPSASPLDMALFQENVTGPQADIARSIYQQESGSGANTKTSNAGAVGGMQVIPATFGRMADKGWNINDPVQNARAGVRYINKLYDIADGDPSLTAAGYYGGEGAIDKARRGVSVSDPRNPNAPNTLQYGQQVASRLGGMADSVAKAILPAAQAEGVPQDNWWASAPMVDGAAGNDNPLPEGDRTGVLPLNQNNLGRMGQAEFDAATQQNANAAFDPNKAVSDSLRLFADSPDPIEGAKGLGAGLGQGVGQVALGAQNYLGKGLSAIGAERQGQWLQNDAEQGRAKIDKEAEPFAQYAPFQAGLGRLAGNVAATGPVGGLLAKALGAGAGAVGMASPTTAKLVEALRTGGTSLGGAPVATTVAGKAADLGIRSAGGAAQGAATAGLVNPDDAGLGAIVGGAFPVAGKAAGVGAKALGSALKANISPEVISLANRAKQLGIDIPADRLTNSKPLNAVAAGLNYVPFSGRASTEDLMQSQMNRALTKTFGQDSDNVTMALRKASDDLGSEFDRVLKSNSVKVDPQFVQDLTSAGQRATAELEGAQANIITNQIDEILSKAVNGEIDGQAAYNIKRTLDRIGKRNSPEGFYAGDLRKDLMAALNRSLGNKEAQAFSKTREQYGNMLTLKKLAQNGVDGDVSIARIANMRDIRSPQLQELADIAAQFLKPREGQHGAAQRAFAGLGAAALAAPLGAAAGPAALLGGAALGRGLNAGLNSNMLRQSLMNQNAKNPALVNALREIMPVSSRIAPVLAAQ